MMNTKKTHWDQKKESTIMRVFFDELPEVTSFLFFDLSHFKSIFLKKCHHCQPSAATLLAPSIVRSTQL